MNCIDCGSGFLDLVGYWIVGDDCCVGFEIIDFLVEYDLVNGVGYC